MFDILKNLPVERRKDYILNVLRHLTFKKIINIIYTEYNLWRKKIIIGSHPYVLTLDPTNICHLRCPLCSTGQRKNLRPPGKMPFALFKKIIDEIGEFLVDVHLLWWGEPFINEKILDFVEYAHNHNIGTFISTNFSLPLTDGQIRRIVTSGLDIINISLDGITREVYNKYRVGGNFDLVIKNLRKLIQYRNELDSKHPAIEWQFLVNRYNEHQIPKLMEKAHHMGVDSVIFEQLLILFGQSDKKNIELEKWLPKNPLYRPKEYSRKTNKSDNLIPGSCWWLYRGTAISHDGGVSPCCYNNNIKYDFGNITKESFVKIWNNSKYQYARSQFTKYPHKAFPTPIICDTCAISLAGRKKEN